MSEVSKPYEKLLKEFFFEAMQRGYATSPERLPFPCLPGAKCTRYERDDYLFVDFWLIKPNSHHSHGMTVISIAERPAWVMHYGGWYLEWAIPFLKRALARNYADKFFLGGRGPERLEDGEHIMQYLNKVDGYGFENFWGHERIISTSKQNQIPPGNLIGEHRYFGGTMW